MNAKLVEITLELMDAADFLCDHNTYSETFHFVYSIVLKAYAVGCQDYYMVDSAEDADASPVGADAEAFDREIDNTPSFCF